MEKLDITETLIRDLVAEVAPLVRGATGWSLAVPSLRSRVLAKDRGYEEVILGRLQGAGIHVDENKPRGIVERLIEYVVESNVLGAYQPSSQELLVVRENVDESNLDGLKLVVAHELVHRGQHVNFGHLFDEVDEVIREVFAYLSRDGASLGEAMQKLGKARPIMTLLESHAHYVQNVLQQTHFPDAKIESHFNLATLLMRLFGKDKLAQYTEGIPAVAAAADAGEVESLYLNL